MKILLGKERLWFFAKIFLIMKVLLVFFFLTCVQATEKVIGQNISIKLKGATLEEVLSDISRQARLDLVYDSKLLSDSRLVEVNLNNATLKHALDKVLVDQPYDYELKKNTLILFPKVKNTKLKVGNEISKLIDQQKSLTGKVVGPEGKPLPGVTVSIKGQPNATTTDGSGSYNLVLGQEANTVVFSMIGYETIEVSILNKLQINVEMKASVDDLEEVVVTGYQTIRKKLFTGAATTVKADDIKLDGIVDVSRMLEGRVAGVSVQNVSGTFGAAPKIRVRGATSITGENKPLWVVDGVVLEDMVNVSNDELSSGDPMTLIGSSVAGINADDIESFEILKDASATALYGARAMNGVVVITTKKGQLGKPAVRYNGNFSSYLKPSYANFNIMNSAEQMSVYAELQRKGHLRYASNLISSTGGVYTKMSQLIDTYDATTGKYGIENTVEGRASFLQRYVNANTDWFDILFNNSFAQEHSMSISSGTENVKNYLSISYYDDNGWTIADNVSRYTANLRSDYKLSDKFSSSVIVNGSIRDQVTPGSQKRLNQTVFGAYSREFDINPFSYALNTSRALTAYQPDGALEFFDVLPVYQRFQNDDGLEYFTSSYAPFNIINELVNNRIELNVLDLKIQGDVTYNVLDNLKYNALGSVRYAKTTRENMITEYSNMANAYRAAYNSSIISANRYLYNDPDYADEYKQIVLPQGGFYMRNDNILRNFYARHTVSFSDTYADNHIVNGFIGQEIKYAERQNAHNNGYGYQFDKGGVPFTDYRIIKQALESNFDYFGMEYNWDRYVSLFANASYSYAERYVVNATARYDGSNRMGKSKTARWLPTWTISAAWNIDQESFMQDVSVIDYLKLRGTYGLTASMGNARNSAVVLNNTSTLRPFLSENEARIAIAQLENSELTWEKQYESNIGLDLGLWRNKLSITVDAYKRNGFDLISSIRTSGIGGQSSKVANYADMTTKGVELNIGTKVNLNSDWHYGANFTFGYNENKISNLKTFPRIFDLIIPEGGPKEGGAVRGLYSIDFKGLDPTNGVPRFINENGEESPKVYFQSTNTDFLRYEGPVDPIITGGLSNTFKYKDLSLNVFFSYQVGNKIRLDQAFRNSYSDLDATPLEFADRWVLPGDENYTNVPSIMDARTLELFGTSYAYNAYNYSQNRVADGSFIRLKTVVLNYNIPTNFSNKLGIKSSSLALNGTNLWLLYADPILKGQDPEFFNAGGVALPMPKQFTLTLRVGL